MSIEIYKLLNGLSLVNLSIMFERPNNLYDVKDDMIKYLTSACERIGMKHFYVFTNMKLLHGLYIVLWNETLFVREI